MARDCPFGLCDGSGILVDEVARTSGYCRCRGQVVANARARGLSAVIPKKYRGVSFDRPPITTIRDGIVTYVRRYVREIDQRLDAGEGLWLHGPVGTGKTSLAMLVSAAALDAGRTVAPDAMLVEVSNAGDDPRCIVETRRDRNAGSVCSD